MIKLAGIRRAPASLVSTVLEILLCKFRCPPGAETLVPYRSGPPKSADPQLDTTSSGDRRRQPGRGCPKRLRTIRRGRRAYAAFVPSDPPSQARLELPSWLWGGNATQLLAECPYKSREDGSSGRLVQPEETYLRCAPHLVSSMTVAGPGEAHPRFDDLAFLRERIELPMPSMVAPALELRKAKAEQSQALVDVLNFERLQTYATPVEDLPERAKHLLDYLRTISSESGAVDSPFAGAGLDIVQVDPALPHRLKLASIRPTRWNRMQGWGMATDAHRTGPTPAAGFRVIGGVYDGVFTDLHVAPLLAALAPSMWGFNIVRTFGSMLFSFGRCVRAPRAMLLSCCN